MPTNDRGAGPKRPQPPRAHARRDRHAVAERRSLADIPVRKKHCWTVLKILIATYNHQHTTKQKDVSFKTQHERQRVLYQMFNDLRDRGYPIDPRSLGEFHIRKLVESWRARSLAPGTLQDYLTALRTLADWIGKPGLVRRLEYYVEDPERVQRSGAASHDKSWSGHGVDASEKIGEIARYSEHAAVQLELALRYGMRVKETHMLQPHRALIPAAETGLPHPSAEYYLRVSRGAKGGRQRYIPIDSDEKWQAIARAKALATAPDGHLGYPGLSLKRSLQKFYDIMKRFAITQAELGATAHGLRHQYAHGRYKVRCGAEPPVRGARRSSRPPIPKHACGWPKSSVTPAGRLPVPIVAPLRAVQRPRHRAVQALSIPTPQPRTARPFAYSRRRSIMKRRTLSGQVRPAWRRDRPPALSLPFGRSRSPGPPVAAAGESRGHRAIATRAHAGGSGRTACVGGLGPGDPPVRASRRHPVRSGVAAGGPPLIRIGRSGFAPASDDRLPLRRET